MARSDAMPLLVRALVISAVSVWAAHAYAEQSKMVNGTALRRDVRCVSAGCEGWSAWYEYKSASDKTLYFHFDNHTGIAAFKVITIINYYDQFGGFVGRAEKRTAGPINRFVIYQAAIPDGARDITAEIYWSDSPEGYSEGEDVRFQ